MRTNHVRTTKGSEDKIHEALGLLNEAAKNKKDELYDMIGDKYSHVKDMLADKANNGVHIASKARKNLLKAFQGQEKHLAKSAHEIDKKVRQNPWVFIGSIAAVSFVVGRFLRRK